MWHIFPGWGELHFDIWTTASKLSADIQETRTGFLSSSGPEIHAAGRKAAQARGRGPTMQTGRGALPVYDSSCSGDLGGLGFPAPTSAASTNLTALGLQLSLPLGQQGPALTLTGPSRLSRPTFLLLRCDCGSGPTSCFTVLVFERRILGPPDPRIHLLMAKGPGESHPRISCLSEPMQVPGHPCLHTHTDH